jgi:4-amino-4-deoxy-L-arabinose transferase-like glycosyltransferase
MLGGIRLAGRTTRTASTVVASTSVEEPATLGLPAVGSSRAEPLAGVRRLVRSVPWALCLITAVAAVLRFAELEDVGANQFYDAAVRSMSLSWHNLFFGAFDPGAFLSVDKPPLDLWLQVASVKLFGWSAGALKLPEAVGGTLAVPLLYDAVRRAVGKPAGLAAAMALAVLPESVLTSRSDTMDSLMMLLVVAALWLTVHAATTGQRRSVILAGLALGLAFNVKLLEALIAAPALVVLYLLASQVPWRRRLTDTLLAGGALVAVGLSWAVAVSLAPGRHPFPVGSSDGTVWNVMFVFNGFGRVSRAVVPHHHAGGPGLLRLVETSPWHFNVTFGCVLIAALALGGAAAARAIAPRPGTPPAAAPLRPRQLPGALAAALVVWIVLAVVLFDHVAILHSRYLEALAPAVAAAIGFGAAVLAGLFELRGRPALPSVPAITIALACVCTYALGLKPWSIAWGTFALAVAAVGAALLARSASSRADSAKWLTVILIMATVLLFPIHESLSLVRSKASDSMGLAVHAPATEAALWSYLGPRTAGAQYELAVDEPLALAPLIIHDQRPILPLTSFLGTPAVGLDQLQAAVRSGAVRYALIGAHRCAGSGDKNAACVPAAAWVRQNGIDVSRAAGVGLGQRLYLLLPY